MLFVTNPLDRSVTLKSFCGDSVQVPAKTRGVGVADKFGWQVPAGVKVVEGPKDVVDPTEVVPSPEPPDEVIKPPRSSEDAKALSGAGGEGTDTSK